MIPAAFVAVDELSREEAAEASVAYWRGEAEGYERNTLRLAAKLDAAEKACHDLDIAIAVRTGETPLVVRYCFEDLRAALSPDSEVPS
jgi:hypothetical protein